MTFEHKQHEIVILCDQMGIVKEYLVPNNHVSQFFKLEQSFMYHIDPQSLPKALNFLAALSVNQFATNYEVNFMVDHILENVYLSGFVRDGYLLIIVTDLLNEVSKLNEELIKINSEQVNQMRSLLKEKINEKKAFANQTSDYFDEISKLNNELLNSKRELAKKNQELNRLNEALERLATRDPLTGLYNRRLLFDKFKEEKKRADRLDYPLSLAVIDLNHFKKVNDQLGHLAGDELLKSFAQLILSMTRQDFDQAFRIGGDEFLILFANCPIDEAERILMRINTAFVKLSDIASMAYGVIAIESSCARDEDDIDACILKADALMFEHKKVSRN